MSLKIKVLSNLMLATLQNNIETINRRIYRLAKAFGKTSYTFKNEIAFLQKGALQKFMGESSSGTPKVDYMKIKKFLQSGADLDEVNEILSRMGGMKITEDGEIVKTGTEIPTVGKMKSDAYKKMRELNAERENVYDFIESMNKFSSDFQTQYNLTMKDVGSEDMENDPIVGQLWSENRGSKSKLEKPRKGESGKGKLTYHDMEKIYHAMIDLRIKAAEDEEEVENIESINLPF